MLISGSYDKTIKVDQTYPSHLLFLCPSYLLPSLPPSLVVEMLARMIASLLIYLGRGCCTKRSVYIDIYSLYSDYIKANVVHQFHSPLSFPVSSPSPLQILSGIIDFYFLSIFLSYLVREKKR